MDGRYLPDDEIDIYSLSSPYPPEYVPQMFSGGEVEKEAAPSDFASRKTGIVLKEDTHHREALEAYHLEAAKQKLALWAEKNQPEMLTANNNELAVILMGMRRDLLTGDDRSPIDQGWIREDNPWVVDDYQTLPSEDIFRQRRQMPRPESFDYPRLKKGHDIRELEKEFQDDIFERERDWEKELGLPYNGPYHRGGPYSHGGEVEKDINYYTTGGEASIESQTEAMNKYLLAEEEDAIPTAYATTPYVASESAAPKMSMQTAKSMLKKLAKGESSKSKRSKGMDMEIGGLSPAIPELGAPPTEHEKLVHIATGRSQYDVLEKAYKLKALAAQRAGKGLRKPTFNAVMFDKPTLERPGPLMARTFQVGGIARAAKSFAKKGAPSVDAVVPSSARSLFAQDTPSLLPSIIKEEGGNWLGGAYSPETFVRPLYKAEDRYGTNWPNSANAKSLNKWIKKKLVPYIKNKMGTPSDPVRIQAEREGILPFPDTSGNAEVTAYQNRIAAGLPGEQQRLVSTTTRGQAWENRADASINVGPYQDMVPIRMGSRLNASDETLRDFGGEFAVQNPTAKVSAMNTGGGPEDLGLDHIIDVLQEDLTIRRLRPDSLDGLSVEDAVRRTYEYDLEMADKMKKAQIQSLEGMPVHKAYPEQGFRWMQLDKPGYFAAESDAMGHSVRGYEPPVGHADWIPQSGNRGTLDYGGYGGWEAIKSGNVKVYSLADDQGKRYATVETVKAQHPLDYMEYGLEKFLPLLPRGHRAALQSQRSISYGPFSFPTELINRGGPIHKEKLQEIYDLGKKLHFENPNAYAENRILSGAPPPSPMDSFQKAADQIVGELPFNVAQIKGQINTSVAQDAQPFIQDFLNSGNWSEVNDLHLTGLRDIRKPSEGARPGLGSEVEKYIKSNQLDNRRFLTEAEYQKYETDFIRDRLTNQRLGGFDPLSPPVQPEGMARGGMVQHFDGGGIAVPFPEESDSYSAEPAKFIKDAIDSYDRLKASPTARKQLAKIAAIQLSQGIPDLAGVGVEYLIDPIIKYSPLRMFTKLKNRSVLEGPANQREPLFGSLSDALKTKEGNYIWGSEDAIKRAQDAKLMGPGRFSPLIEGGASLVLGAGASAAKVAAIPTAKFLGKEVARQVERGMFNEGPRGPWPVLRYITPQPLYIVRPPGGYFPTSRSMAEKTAEEINNTSISDLPEDFISWLNTDDKKKSSLSWNFGSKTETKGEKYNRWRTETGNKIYTHGVMSDVDLSLQPALKKIMEMEPGEKRDALFQMFNQKAKDFYSKQAGSIQDPLRADILSGRFKFEDKSALGDVFPKVLVKQAARGDLQALRLLEKNYDEMIDIRATVPYRLDGQYPDANTLKSQIIESVRDNLDTIPDSQLLAYAGKKPLPGPDGVAKAAAEVRLKLKENPNLFSIVLEPNIERTVFAKQNITSDLNLAQYPNSAPTATKAMINPQGPKFTRQQLDKMETLPRGYFLPEMEAAIDKSQPILDATQYRQLKLLDLSTDKLLQEANKISAKDLNNMGFTDFLKKAYTSTQEVAQIEKDLEKVKSLLQKGKNPPAKAMLFGVTDFLPTVNDMRWVKVTDPDGVKSIAAGMANSIASYATTNTYGALQRGRRALDSGEVEVYALYDKNHVPHVAVEYGTGKSSVPEKQRSQILTLTGNGPLTANALSSNYAEQIAALVNALPIKDVTALPVGTQKVLKDNFFEFKDNRVVRNEEEFAKHQAVQKELGRAKGGLVDKNIAFIKAHA